MRAVPLAAVILLSSAAFAAAADCPVPMSGGAGEPRLALDAASPACRAASGLVADVARLRAAAGYAESELSFSVDPDTSDVNAYYQTNGVWISLAYLSAPDVQREALLATLAHEIGHGVQDRQGLFAWAREPKQTFLARTAGAEPTPEFDESPEAKDYYARSRRFEAHADAIGQELLVRAGYDPGLFTRGREKRWGCQSTSGLWEDTTTHPAHAQRYLNAALSRGALADTRARDASARIAAGLGGGSAREAPGPVAASPVKPAAFRPASSIEDYDARGQVKPGRLVSSRLRVAPPPPDAGPLRRNATDIAASVVDYWIAEPFQAAVDRIALSQNRVAVQVLQACGKTEAEDFGEDFSVLGWARKVAADAALRATGARKPARALKTVSLGVPG